MSDEAPKTQREILERLATNIMDLALKCDRTANNASTWRQVDGVIAEAFQQRRDIERVPSTTIPTKAKA